MVIRHLALVGLLLAAAPAFAQESPPSQAWHQDGARHHKFEARLADIEAKLNLTATQKPLWDGLVQVIKTNMRNRFAHFRAEAGAAPQDAPTRLDDRLAMLKEETLGVEQEKAALTPLWASLDAGQRDTLSKAIAWHPHRDKGWQHHPDSAQ